MRTVIRDTCRGCNSSNLLHLEQFTKYPFFDDIVDAKKKGKEYTDELNIIICNDCSLLQNPKDINFEDYYIDYVYSVGSSKFASSYMHELVEKTLSFTHHSKGTKVIDIGCSDGELLSFFKKRGCSVLGFEGSKYLSKKSHEKGIPTVNSLFDSNSKLEIDKYSMENPDLICLLHTFDHLPDPNQFLSTIRSILNIGSYLLMEVHSLDKMIQKNEGAIFAHEHTCYYSEVTLKNLLHRHGFQVINYNFIEDSKMRGSSQVVLCKLTSSIDKFIIDSHDINLSTKEFIFRLNKANKAVKDYIHDVSNHHYKVSGFGGWGRGIGSIVQANLTESELYCVFDNNHNLDNCFIPGSNIPIYNPTQKILEQINEIIVFNYGYIDEISRQILNLTDKDIKITNINEIRQFQ